MGLGAGLRAVGLRWLISVVQEKSVEPAAGTWWLFVVPIVGGLFVGPITHFFASEARGHGVPEIMEAVALRGGRIRKRVAAAKAVTRRSPLAAAAQRARKAP